MSLFYIYNPVEKEILEVKEFESYIECQKHIKDIYSDGVKYKALLENGHMFDEDLREVIKDIDHPKILRNKYRTPYAIVDEEDLSFTHCGKISYNDLQKIQFSGYRVIWVSAIAFAKLANQIIKSTKPMLRVVK